MQRIMVATDLASNQPQPFSVALRLAQLAHSQLKVVHVHDEEQSSDWRKLPTVRSLLEQWGALAPDASLEDFDALGLRVMPLEANLRGDLPSELVVRAHEHAPDLLIMGTSGRVGLERMLHPSVAEPVARSWGGPTLIVPAKGRKVVGDDGTLNLRKVLIPIDASAPPQRLVQQLVRLLDGLQVGHVEFVLVHIGELTDIPDFDLPERADWLWRSELFDGSVVETILQLAEVEDADLIAMSTHGHDSLLDALRGSTTERVLRRAPCAVFVVPLK